MRFVFCDHSFEHRYDESIIPNRYRIDRYYRATIENAERKFIICSSNLTKPQGMKLMRILKICPIFLPIEANGFN